MTNFVIVIWTKVELSGDIAGQKFQGIKEHSTKINKRKMTGKHRYARLVIAQKNTVFTASLFILFMFFFCLFCF